MDQEKIRIPVRATYKIIDGEPVMVDAQYEEIDPKVIAEFLLARGGKSLQSFIEKEAKAL